jgi:hypothetical protein
MTQHSSASTRLETSHATNPTLNQDIRRRAYSIISDNSYDYYTRQLIRYSLNIDDPLTPDLVRRAELGEDISDNPITPQSGGGSFEEANGTDINDSNAQLVDALNSDWLLDNELDATDADRLLDDKLERLTMLICQPGNEPFTTCAALLVLMSTISNDRHPKLLITTV